MEPLICRTCATLINNKIDTNKEILNKLIFCIPEINLWLISDTNVCHNCYSTINVMYKFKMNCRQVENKINTYLKQYDFFHSIDLLPLATNKNEVPLNNTRRSSVRLKTYTICRICLRLVTSDSLNEKPLDRLQLVFCIPEMDMKLKPDLNKSCRECYTVFNVAYNFKGKVLEVESNFNKYLKEHAKFNTKDFLNWNKHKVDVKLENVIVIEEEIDLEEEAEIVHYNTRLSVKKSNKNKSQNKENLPNVTTKTKKKAVIKIKIKDEVAKMVVPYNTRLSAKKSNKNNESPLNDTNKIDNIKMGQEEAETLIRRNTRSVAKTRTSKKSFKCSVCTYKTDIRTNFTAHLRIHSGEKNFQCLHCDYKATRKAHLERHVFIHRDEKPFACPQCEYRTNQKSKLEQHVYIHAAKKLFQCTQCTYSTLNKTYFVDHIREHKSENIMECQFCNYKTGKKAHMERHSHVHNGEKPFACTNCTYKTSSKTNLSSHFLIHTGEKPFECPHCEYRSNKKQHLTRHQKIHRESTNK